MVQKATKLSPAICFSIPQEMGMNSSQSALNITKLLDRLPGMIYRSRIINPENMDLVLEYVSKGSEYLLGIAPDEMIAQRSNTIERMMPENDCRRIREHIITKIRHNESYQIMYRVILPNGVLKWLWDQGEAIYSPEGIPIFLEGIIVDVSEQKFFEMHLQEENRQLKFSLEQATRLGPLVGKSEAMHKIYGLILKAAETDTNVIIYGETGCGKDVVARAIHQYSGRKGAYIPVNCGAVPENLLESEFFGYTKGAFTGASQSKEGYIAAANNGTLFLDEIGELSINLQVKFLRVLETKTYRQLGSNTPKTSNFRLIAATNRNMAELVRTGKARADFYYRVNVLTITLPPLRERKEDIPLLIQNWSERTGIELTFSHKLQLAMTHYDWPGNIRELHNFLDRYATFGESAVDSITSKEMLLDLPLVEGLTLAKATEKLEHTLILRALEKCHWHRNKTAQHLGLTLRTLQRKMKALNITEK